MSSIFLKLQQLQRKMLVHYLNTFGGQGRYLPFSISSPAYGRRFSFHRYLNYYCNNNGTSFCSGAVKKPGSVTGSCGCHGDNNNFQRLLLTNTRRGLATTSCLYAEDNEKVEDARGTGEKLMRIKLKAQRLDAVLKAGLSMSRNKIEKAVYDDRVRVNGLRPGKKSQIVFEGDEIDIVRGYNPLNPENFIDVSRVEIVELNDGEGGELPDDDSGSDDNESRIPAVLRRSRLLTIKNYPKPWKGSSQE